MRIPRARTGIFRWSESVALRCIRSPEVEVSFCGVKHPGALEEWVESNGGVLASNEHPGLRRLARSMDRVSLADLDSRDVPHRIMRFSASMAKRLIPGKDPDMQELVGVDVFHGPHYAHFPRRFPSSWKGRKFMTVYDLIPLIHPEWFRWHEAKDLRRAIRGLAEDVGVVSISHSTTADLVERTGISPSRVNTVHPGFDSRLFHNDRSHQSTNKMRQDLGIPNAPYYLCLNTQEPRKNMSMAIRAFAALAGMPGFEDHRLVLAGPTGWGASGSKVFGSLRSDVRDRILFVGFVEDSHLAALYGAAVGFLFPSLYEGFGFPVLEAMACGTPVISSATSSLPEIVGDAGTLLDPQDLDAWVGAMASLGDEASEELSARAILRADLFRWDRSFARLLEAWRGVAVSPAP